MVTKVLTGVEKRVDRKYKKKQKEPKITITEMKNNMRGNQQQIIGCTMDQRSGRQGNGKQQSQTARIKNKK